MMAGKIEIRTSGEKFRFVVLNRSGEKLLRSGQFDDKPSTRRAASSLARAVSGAEIIDATKPGRRQGEKQRTSPRHETLTRGGPTRSARASHVGDRR
jgi:hypothetical protein